MDKTNLHYPNRYDIEQTLGEFCKKEFAVKFAASNGIFITKASQEILANNLAGFFYEKDDLEKIRSTAFKANESRTLSGFMISSTSEEFNLIELVDDLRNNHTLPNDAQLGLMKELKDETDQTYFKGSYSYIHKKPGRIQFLEEEQRDFDFIIKPFEDNSYQVLIETSKSNDSKEFEDLLKKKVGKESTLKTLDSERLTANETILFFERLSQEGMSNEWRFTDVRQLKFKKPSDNSSEAEEVDESVLSGIRQAVLDGINLRDNEFVKKAEDSGYSFTEVGFYYENKKHPYHINIKAEFKSRPKVFEVSILSYYEIIGEDERKEKAALSDKEEIAIKTYFWQKAKEIYDRI